MCEEGKKISFGFSKLTKKTSIVSSKLNQSKPNPDEKRVELIDCFEGNTIKLKNPVKVEDKVLIIPLKKQDNKLPGEQIKSEVILGQTSNNLKLRSVEETVVSSAITDNSRPKQDSNLADNPLPKPTLDELAAKEILEDLNSSKVSEEKRIFSVPLTNNPPEGEKESTLDDYESIPIEDFGLAMLRGMGWAPGKGIGKHEKLLAPTPSAPALRPKGMGLGADKVINAPEKSRGTEDLQMVKGSFVRIVAGPHKDSYGQIEGFDDEAGRLIVRLALKNLTASLNEFMIQLVTKDEFTKNSKVLNVAKYEEYKECEKNSDSLDKVKVQSVPVNKTKSSKRETTPDSVRKPVKETQGKGYSSSDSDSHVEKSQSKKSSFRVNKKANRPRSISRDRQRRSRSRSRVRESYKKKSSHSKYDMDTIIKGSRRSRSYSSEEDYKRRRKSRSTSRGNASSKLKSKSDKKKFSRSRDSSESSESSSNSTRYSRKHKNMKKKKQRSRSRSKSSKGHRSRY